MTPQGDDQPPLKIAIMDKDGYSPFSVAVLRGHRDVGKAILEIALAQYTPEDKTDKSTTRYSMTQQYHDDSDYDSEVSDDEDKLEIYKQIVDDKFTVENIGEVSLAVKSHVTPLSLLHWACPVKRFSDGMDVDSLISYAILADDSGLLGYLLDLGTHWSTTTTENGITALGTFYSVKSTYLDFAISLGRINIISELLKRTGCGIPFEELVKKSGVKIEEKPKYYQGLSVYGKKRTDWAAAGRRMQVQTMTGSSVSPLVTASKAGTLESLEYWLSDTPLRLYYSTLR